MERAVHAARFFIMITKKTIIEGFLTIYIVDSADGKFVVRINGKQIKKPYDTIQEAKAAGMAGAAKLLGMAQAALSDGSIGWTKK